MAGGRPPGHLRRDPGAAASTWFQSLPCTLGGHFARYRKKRRGGRSRESRNRPRVRRSIASSARPLTRKEARPTDHLHRDRADHTVDGLKVESRPTPIWEPCVEAVLGRQRQENAALMPVTTPERMTGLEPRDKYPRIELERDGKSSGRESAPACASVAIAHDTAPALRLRVWIKSRAGRFRLAS